MTSTGRTNRKEGENEGNFSDSFGDGYYRLNGDRGGADFPAAVKGNAQDLFLYPVAGSFLAAAMPFCPGDGLGDTSTSFPGGILQGGSFRPQEKCGRDLGRDSGPSCQPWGEEGGRGPGGKGRGGERAGRE